MVVYFRLRGQDRQTIAAGSAAIALLVAAVIGLFVGGPTTTKEHLAGSGGPSERESQPAASVTASATPRPGETGPITGGGSSGSAPGQGGGSGVPVPGTGGTITRGPATGSPVTIGAHLGDNKSAAAAFGVGGLANISEPEVNAIVRDVNATGGLANHPMKIVFHKTDPLKGSFDQQGQIACEDFTQDHHVAFVVDTALTPSKVTPACLSKAGVPDVWMLHMAIVSDADDASFKDMLYRPSMPNADRYGFAVDDLYASGFFKNAKVGIIRYDTSEAELISNKEWKPRLAKYHVPVVSEYKVTVPGAAAGAAGLSGQSSNAIVQFKDDGVTHVLMVPSGGAIPLVFYPNAASQGWYPMIGITTQDAPGFVATNNPEQQLEKTWVIGWSPDIDRGDAGPGSGVARCRAAVKKAGLAWDAAIQQFCDGFYFLQRALTGASAATAAALHAGAEKIGTSYVSSHCFGTRFAPGHLDGPVQARLMRYKSSEKKFAYTGPLYEFN